MGRRRPSPSCRSPRPPPPPTGATARRWPAPPRHPWFAPPQRPSPLGVRIVLRVPGIGRHEPGPPDRFAHATRGVGEALGRAVLAHGLAHLPAPAAEGVEPAALQLGRALVGTLIPGGARLRVAIARSRIADDEGADHLGMGEMEAQRGVATQREATDHRALHSHVPEEGGHVGHGEIGRVFRRIAGALRLPMPAHAPADDLVVLEGAVLAVPHAPRGRVAVAQKHGGPTPRHLVVDLDSVQPGSAHRGSPFPISVDQGRIGQDA